MSEKSDLESLLKNISEGLKVYSVKELNEAIIECLNKKHDKREEVEFILNMIAGDYLISRRILIHSTARGRIQEARQLSYCLLHFNLGLPIRHIAKRIFSKWHNSVAIAIKQHKNLNVAIKHEREFKEKYDSLQTRLIEHITKQKQ